MDSRDVIGLYEAYFQVYEDQYMCEETEIDESKADNIVPPEHRANLRNARAGFQVIDPKSPAATTARRREHKERRGLRSNMGGEGASTYRYDDNHDKDYPYIKVRGRGNVEEDLDMYDIVLDYLIEEGFCDDVESAEVVMANMSEEWLETITEGKKKIINQLVRLGRKSTLASTPEKRAKIDAKAAKLMNKHSP
jgi:hypothetical protein